jgi:tetratricopeptide (TPR) repeat protein/cellulose biosynthesis protein BcsQ
MIMVADGRRPAPEPVAPEAPRSPRVITFYSYKGGTGRSMALANVGVLLAQRCVAPDATLLIDFDLEAPGLHRYFPQRADQGPMSDPQRPGLIDLFCRIESETRGWDDRSHDQRTAGVRDLLRGIDLGEYVTPTSVPQLHLMKAGRLDAGYAALVNGFHWNDFYARLPSAVRLIVEALSARYRHVLVDSRTGITDTSDICTMLLPDKLVVVFTPNAQSLEGVSDLIQRAVTYRDSSDDIRPFVIYPLPSRIETTEPSEQDAWRLGDTQRGLQGWQSIFEQTIASAYGLTRCDLGKYFDEVQIQHQGFYAYGEKIAVMLERGTEIASMPKRYERFVGWLVDRSSPWEDPALAAAAARRRRAMEQGNAADRAYASLATDDDRAIAERLFLRLVRLLGDKEVGEYARRVASIESDFAGDPESVMRVVSAFASCDVITVTTTRGKSGTSSSGRDGLSGTETAVQIADDLLFEGWARLREWVQQHREFLVWRQRLEAQLEAWSAHGRAFDLLLRTEALDEALRWRDAEQLNLSPLELEFIERSETLQRLKGGGFTAAMAVPSQATLAGLRPPPAARSARSSRWQLPAFIAVAVLTVAAMVVRPFRSSAGRAPITAVADALVARADGDMSAGHADSALARLDSAIALGSVSAEIRGKLGQAWLALDRPAAADSQFAQAIVLDSGYAPAYMGRSSTRLANGDTAGALADLDHAIRLDSTLVYAFEQRATIRASQGDVRRAIQDYTQAARSQPNRASLYFDRGLLNQRVGSKDSAISDFRAAAKLAPDSVLRLAAQARLRALGVDPRQSASTDLTVLIQYSTPADSGLADALYRAFEAAKTRATTPELRRGDGTVRYFTMSDSAEAEQVRQFVEAFLAQQGTVVRLRSVEAKADTRVPPRQIEVWLPSLQSVSGGLSKVPIPIVRSPKLRRP